MFSIKESNNFKEMFKKTRVSKTCKSVRKYSKLLKYSLLLNFMINYVKSIKQVCKESDNEFKYL